ncbi:transporter substrate-binding domain-containing protein [Pseudoalteromonas shioyasakiensis]|uniref:transporter substrate-binding domain-containing protein n=1 Tax=Pseudoalteromonas TaxID=53246 RepID=UPI0020960D78|nr:transporter substrate-binding domain-containing protein [Pseudoalteromonas shioyasakiensis]MCO6355933.1 transporter substrate-binding domain-containing protein [Pseudoalteromonas shioyasakiensis]|tara:strand:+ start:189 stop:1079 length:891 start_codon:yes stop_codon:yes gene_type:complete
MKKLAFNYQKNRFFYQMAWVFNLPLVLVVTFISITVKANEKSALTILTPSYFANEYDEKNINQHFYKVIEPALSDEFQLSVQFTNHARVMKRLASEKTSCTYNAIKTPERAKNMLFSNVPTYMHMQRQLFALKPNIDNIPSSASVESLLANKQIFGVIGSTSYQQLDPIFEKHNTKIAHIYGENPFLQLSKLLLNRRIDYIVAYRESLYSHLDAKQLKLISSRTIKEYPQFINGFFTCSKTAAGYRAIALIDEYMKSAEMAAYIQQLHSQSNHPDDAKAMLDLYSKSYGIRFENSN